MSVAERREREREARREHILDAAERVFYERGFEVATMEEIAERAQLGKGTLYLYFKTKQDLALGLAVRHQLAIVERFEERRRRAPDGLTQLRDLLEAYATHMSTPIEHLKLVLSRWVSAEPFDLESEGGKQARANIDRIFGVVCASIVQAQDEGALRLDLPAPKLAVFMWSSVNGALLMRLKARCFHQHEEPFGEHGPSLREHIDILLESLRPLEADASRASETGAKRQVS